jgi:hypothetical protein
VRKERAAEARRSPVERSTQAFDPEINTREAAMPDEPAPWHVFEYEGFEIHVLPHVKPIPEHAPARENERYVYIGHICRRGANANAPGEAVHFHADGNDEFKSADDAVQDARHIGRSIIDGTHPDLSVLALVSHHRHE